MSAKTESQIESEGKRQRREEHDLLGLDGPDSTVSMQRRYLPMDTLKPASSPFQSQTVSRYIIFQTSNANSCHTRWSSNLVRHVIWAPYKVHIKTHKPNTLVCCIILYALLQFRKCLEVQSVSENHVWEGGETASKAESTTKRRVETVPPLPSASLVPSKGRLQRLKTEPHRKDTRKKALRMSSR